MAKKKGIMMAKKKEFQVKKKEFIKTKLTTTRDTLSMQKCAFIMLFFPYKQNFFGWLFWYYRHFILFENIFLFKYALNLVFYGICDQITILGQLFDARYVKKKKKKKKKKN